MRVLVIEDEPHVVEELREHMRGGAGEPEFIEARSLESGVIALAQADYDYIVCDLKIPPRDGSLASSEQHGLFMYRRAREVCPGTPTLFFTGFGTNRTLIEELSRSPIADIYGNGDWPLSKLFTKEELRRCAEWLRAAEAEIARLEEIRVVNQSGEPGLDRLDQRALRVLARRRGGIEVQVSPRRGFSGARTMLARIVDGEGRLRAMVFGKIDDRSSITEERARFDEFVSPFLVAGACPAIAGEVLEGLGRRGAIFYQLASESGQTLFDLVEENATRAVEVIRQLRRMLAPWAQTEGRMLTSLRQLRADVVGLVDISGLAGMPEQHEEIESMDLELRTSCQHGDLHGLNVLIASDGGPVLVDFGGVGISPRGFDAVTMEMSLLFHPGSPLFRSDWLSPEKAEEWTDVIRFVDGCPAPDVIGECRKWALEESADATSFLAIAYAVAVRQLRYPETDRGAAAAIARSCMKALRVGPV